MPVAIHGSSRSMKALPSLPVDVGEDETDGAFPVGQMQGYPSSLLQPALSDPSTSSPGPIRRPFQDLKPTQPPLNPYPQSQSQSQPPHPSSSFSSSSPAPPGAQSSIDLPLPIRPFVSEQTRSSARSEGFPRPVHGSRPVPVPAPVPASVSGGNPKPAEAGNTQSQRRRVKGRLGVGLPLSRLFGGSSVDLLGDLSNLPGGTRADHPARQQDQERTEKGATDKEIKGKSSWLPFRRQRPTPSSSHSSGPQLQPQPHTRAGSESSPRLAVLTQTETEGRPRGRRMMTTGNLDTVYGTFDGSLANPNSNSNSNSNSNRNPTSSLECEREREKPDSPVLLISASAPGPTSGLKRKGSIKNMLDKFSSRPRAGPGERKVDRNNRKEDEDGVGWDMMSAKQCSGRDREREREGEGRSFDTIPGSNSASASAPGSNGRSGMRSGSVSASASGSGSGRPSADSSKEGYSTGDIVPRLSEQDRGNSRPEAQVGVLAVPGGKVKRRPSWRKGGRKEKEVKQEEDDGIGAPMLVQGFQHDLHVTASFKGLPPAWIEQLRQQGIGQKEMEMIMSGRRQKDSICSMENLVPKAGLEIAASPLRRIGLPEIVPDGSPFVDKKMRGLTLPGAYVATPLRPAPRPMRSTDDLAKSNDILPDSLARGATPMGTLIDRDLLRSPTKERPAKHLRASSENLLASVKNGIQLGHKKSVSYLVNLQPGVNSRDDEPHVEKIADEPKRPLRFRRRAGTEDSPLLLNLSKDASSSAGPELYSAFTPIKSQARSRLSTEVKNFGTIKLSFETDLPEGLGGDDWAGEVLMSFDQGLNGVNRDLGPPRPSMDSAMQVPRSVSVETGASAYYQHLRPLDIPDSRFELGTPLGIVSGSTADTEPSEMIQSPEEIEDDRHPAIASTRGPQYAFLGDRAAYDIVMSMPRTPTPPGKSPRAKKMSVRQPQRKSSLNRGRFEFGSFRRGPNDELYAGGRPSDDGHPQLLYRTISLSPSPELASLPDDEASVATTPSDEQLEGQQVNTARYSESMSWDGPLSTNEDHSFSIGEVHTAWRATPLNFNVFGESDQGDPRDLKRERA